MDNYLSLKIQVRADLYPYIYPPPILTNPNLSVCE